MPWRVLRLVRTKRDHPHGTQHFDQWQVQALAAGDTIRIDVAPGARPVYGARLLDAPETPGGVGQVEGGIVRLGLPHRFEPGEQHRFALVSHYRERVDNCLHRPRLTTDRLSIQVAFADRPRAVWAVNGLDTEGTDAVSPALLVPPDGVVSVDCLNPLRGQPYGLRWSFRAGQ
jgi:hypothetical protein